MICGRSWSSASEELNPWSSRASLNFRRAASAHELSVSNSPRPGWPWFLFCEVDGVGKYKKGKRISFEVPEAAFVELQKIAELFELNMSDCAEFASLVWHGMLATMSASEAYGLVHARRNDEDFCKYVILAASQAIKESVSFTYSVSDPEVDPELFN